MAQTRSSNRLRSKSNSNNRQTSISTQKNVIRDSYSNDIPQSELAFVRLHPPKYAINNEEEGTIHIASIPQKNSYHNWSVHSIFFGGNGTHEIDAFNTVNDDKEYKNHLLSLNSDDWAKQNEFWDEWSVSGKPVKTIYNEGYKNGKRDSTIKIITLLIHQILIFMCVKMTGCLREEICKRGAEQKSYEHLPSFAWKSKHHTIGHDILIEISGNYEHNGDMNTYSLIDWDKITEIVGIENVAKKAGDLYYYADINKITWNKVSQLMTMYFVPVRWDGNNHRHRNIPLLLE